MSNDASNSDILAALKSTETLLKSVLEDRSSSAEKLGLLHYKLENIEKELTSVKHVLTGNGQEGLQVRTKVLEEKVKGLALAQRERSKGKWSVLIALISGLMGLGTAVVVALIN